MSLLTTVWEMLEFIFSRANNKISSVSTEQLRALSALEILDLSSNKLVDVKRFPTLPLKNL